MSQREICASQHDTDTPAKPQVDLKTLNHRVVQTKSFMQVTETGQTVNFSSTYSKTRQRKHTNCRFLGISIFLPRFWGNSVTVDLIAPEEHVA